MPAKNIDAYIKHIQPQIAYCATCQPYDDGEVVWILGRKIDLEEIFDEYEISEAMRDELTSKLVCKGCGRQLCRGDAIGIKTKEEIEEQRLINKKWRLWDQKYEPMIDEFQIVLEKTPYLGLSHKVGKQIYDKIQTFPISEIKNEMWFRARRIEDGRPLKHSDMLPHSSPASEGRFSHYGQSVFYLASEPFAAAVEVLDIQKEDLAWIQKIKIDKIPNILNLYSYIFEDDPAIPLLALGLINKKLKTLAPSKDSTWKPEYFIPRFISDCAKKRGFNGILYYSAKHHAKNLVLFDYKEKNVFSPLGEPQIMQFNTVIFKARG